MTTTIFASIFVFGLIVFIHEFGHFITAKLCNMRVDEFAIGFGPIIGKFRRGETLYSVRAIPLGGFNKIAGMDPDEPLDERSFLSKSVWKRFIVIFAGAGFNFLLAIVLFFFIFASYGVEKPSTEPVVGRMGDSTPASIAHMEKNDRILSIAGKPISTWSDIGPSLAGHGNELIPIVVERDGEQKTLSVMPKESGDRVIIGINPPSIVERYSIPESMTMAVTHTGQTMVSMVSGIVEMVTGKTQGDLAGPIGVAQMAGQIAQVGFIYLLEFTAYLSINLGVINLLPIPVLDGGYLIMLTIEGLTGKRLPTKALYYIQMVGMAILVLIFFYATSSDLMRL